jgi:hypothetical protein
VKTKKGAVRASQAKATRDTWPVRLGGQKGGIRHWYVMLGLPRLREKSEVSA